MVTKSILGIDNDPINFPKLPPEQETIIKFPCLPAQRQLLRSRKRIPILVAGFGAGKTRAAVYKATTLGFMNAPTLGIFIEPTYTLVKDVAFESFKEVYDEQGISYELNKTAHTMIVEDTFQILFRSGEEPSRLIGTNAGWVLIDEPAKQEEEVFKMALARMRDPRAKLRQLCMTGTPEGFNWFHRVCHAEEYKNRVDLIRAKTYDNPFLDEDYIPTLLQMYTKEEAQAYINGEFVQFRGAWYSMEPEVRAPISTTSSGVSVWRDPAETWHPVIGIDTAGGLGRDASAIVVLDGRSGALCASWTSKTATIDTMCEVATEVYKMYTRGVDWSLGVMSPIAPVMVVETNGIGRATFQRLSRYHNLPVVEQKTTEAKRYDGMLLAKRKVEAFEIYGPSELRHEAQNLVVEDGKFVGPKDFSMAVGFALLFIRDNPKKDLKKPDHKTISFSRRLGGRSSRN